MTTAIRGGFWPAAFGRLRPEVYLLAGAWAAVVISADRFYAALGTTPRAVGFDTREVLTSAAAVLLTFAPLAWTAVAASAALLMKFHDDAPVPNAPTLSAAVAALGFFVALVAWFDNAFGSIEMRGVMPAAGFALLGVTAVDPDIPILRSRPVRFASRMLPAIAAASTAAIWLGLWNGALADARNMEPGREPTMATAFLSSNTRVVCAAGADRSTPPVPTTRSLLLLGSSDGRLVLRDWRKAETIVVPSDLLFLRSVGASTRRCT